MAAIDSTALEGRQLQQYAELVPHEILSQVAQLSRDLEGRRVIHVNATPYGGGVAEILRSLVPLTGDVGVTTDWIVPDIDDSFFTITKAIHNCLQGKAGGLSKEQFNYYLHCNEEAAKQIDIFLKPDNLLIVHDPQYLPLLAYLKTRCSTVWICHIDTTSVNEELRDLLLPYVHLYDRVVFSLNDYVFADLKQDGVSIIPPAIDPLTPKNLPMPLEQAKNILAGLGFDVHRPLVTQVSRFDIWKDPWGVVDAYRIAKRAVPGLQLALVGVFDAQDDPEAVEMFRSVQSYVNGEEDIHLFTDPNLVKQREVNAFQRGSEVIVQKSIREGFGLVVTEAMWKGTPVVGGDCAGIRLQIRDGETGFLVNGSGACAERVISLLQDRALAQQIGQAGKESATRNYLIPRLVRDYLALSVELLAP